MPPVIRLVQTDAERHKLYRARYTVLVEEERYLSERADRRIVDRFDPLPTTAHFAAFDDDEVVGGVRFNIGRIDDLPVSQYPEFAALAGREDVAAGSMVFLGRRSRGSGVGGALIDTGLSWAAAHGARHIVAVGNPRAEHFFRKTGHQMTGQTARDDARGVDYQPLLVELARDPPRLGALLRERLGVGWASSLARVLAKPGEELAVAPGTDVFLVAGRVTLISEPQIALEMQGAAVRSCASGGRLVAREATDVALVPT